MNPGKTRQQAAALTDELRGYEMAGTQLYLEGRPSYTEEIVNACIFNENTSYMRDFIEGDEDEICEINFVRIRTEGRRGYYR